MNQEQQSQKRNPMKKKISALLAFGIIILFAIIVGTLIWQYSNVPEVEEPIEKEKAFTGKEEELPFTIPKEHKSNIFDISYLTFSSNHERFAYVVEKEEKYFVVLGGVEQEKYDCVDYLIFSPDSKSFAYTAWQEGKNFIVLDGVEQEKYDTTFFSANPCEKQLDMIRQLPGAAISVLASGIAISQEPYNPNFTFSPDSKHFAYRAVERGGKELVILNGVAHEKYSRVSTLTFSPNSKHFAYEAIKKGKKIIVLGGVEQEQKYDAVFMPTFSPDSKQFVYGVRQGTQRFIVLNGTKTEEKEYARVSDFTFSPDSQRFAYVAWPWQGDERFVVLDGIKRGWEEVYNLTFSPDSKHFAYAVGLGWGAVHLIKMEPQEYFLPLTTGWIIDIFFSPDSQQLAYTAWKNHKQLVVLNGLKHKEYNFVHMPIFSPDSKHFAYVAQQGERQFIVFNEIELKKYDEIYNLSFSANGKYLIYNARDGKDLYLLTEGVKELNRIGTEEKEEIGETIN